MYIVIKRYTWIHSFNFLNNGSYKSVYYFFPIRRDWEVKKMKHGRISYLTRVTELVSFKTRLGIQVLMNTLSLQFFSS